MSWRLARPFILRSAGFAAGAMETLCMPQAAAATDAALQADDEREALGTRLQQDLRGRFAHRRESALRWKSAHKAFASGRDFDAQELHSCLDDAELHAQLLQWNEAVLHARRAQAQAAAAFDAGLLQARQALRGLVEEARFREAVFLSSPHMYRAGLLRFIASPLREQRSAEDKRLERQLVMYLQRVCTKNETTSFFGPIGYGRFEADDAAAATAAAGAWPVSWRHGAALGQRETFMAYWAVEALATALAALDSVRGGLRPRLQPGVRRTSRTTLLVAALNRTVVLSPAVAALLDDVQRGDDVRRLCAAHGTELLALLERKGVLHTGITIPVGEARTLEHLARWLDAVPHAPELEPWRDGIAALASLKAAFAEAGLERRAGLLERAEAIFSSLTGAAAERAAGHIYADRTLFYEECRSGHEDVCVDAACTRGLETRLSRLLDLYARHALERREQLHALGAAMFREVFGPGVERVPFLHFVHQVLARPEADQARWAGSLRGFRSRVQEALLASLVAGDAAERRQVELPAELLESPAMGAMPAVDVPLLASPDLMIARQADGQPLVVLGEVHDTLMVWGWALAFHPRAGELAHEMWRYAEGLRLDRVLNIVGSQRRKILPFEYPGRTVEVRSAAGGVNATVPVSRLDVVLRGGRLELHDGADATPLALHNGELPSLCHALFSLPRCVPFELDLGAHTPRLTADGVVLQRERWRVERGDAGLAAAYPGTSFALFKDLRRLRRRLGLPERCFLKTPTEPKPVHVDFRCHLLLEAWDALFPAGSAVTLSEMLPDTGQLWLTGADGRHVTAELRTAFGRPPDAAPVAHTTTLGAAACTN